MKTLKPLRWAVPVGLVVIALAVAAACGGDGGPNPTPTVSPSPTAEGTPPPAGTPAAAGPLWAKPPIGDDWAQYFGVQMEEELDCSGPAVLKPKPGDLYFYTNAGTGWGATNTKNTVEIFNATDMKDWKPVATVDLPDEYSQGYSSHGATVSTDGRWIYLQSMANPEKPPRLLIIDGFTLKLCKVYRRPWAASADTTSTTSPAPTVTSTS